MRVYAGAKERCAKEDSMSENLDKLRQAVADLEIDDIAPLVTKSLDAGETPTDTLGAMCQGMGTVGELFEKSEYYLADLVLAGEGMKEGLEVLEPHLKEGGTGGKGTVVLCTVKGDIHDIGKNLVGMMLSTGGFKVIDLGTDVGEGKVVEAVKANDAKAVGLSVLLTPMVDSISDVVNALKAAGLRDQVKVAIGGACTTQDLADRMGVDAVGRDAVEAVRIFEGFCS
jgi:methylmalonyl-CoA mutase cobalamin-binding domain/chain